MNKARRKPIHALATKLDELRSQVEELVSEEQNYFDNMPEGLQGSDKGSAAETAIDYLQEAVDSFDTLLDALSSASE